MLIAEKQSTLLPFKFNKYYYKRHPTSHRMPFIVIFIYLLFIILFHVGKNIGQFCKLLQCQCLSTNI